MNATTTAPAGLSARRVLAKLAALAMGLAIVALAAPFVAVSVALIAQLPARMWPEDFATVGSARGAAAEVPEFPGSLIGRLRVDDPTPHHFFGFFPSDIAVDLPYWLPRAAPSDEVYDFVHQHLREFGWTPVRTERTAAGIRAEYRRRALGLILTIPIAPGAGDLVYTYQIRVGGFDGKTLRRTP